METWFSQDIQRQIVMFLTATQTASLNAADYLDVNLMAFKHDDEGLTTVFYSCWHTCDGSLRSAKTLHSENRHPLWHKPSRNGPRPTLSTFIDVQWLS